MSSTYTARKLMKVFTLEEKNRDLISLSDVSKIRLSPEENRILLKKDSDGLYPVNDTTAYVTAWTTTPESMLSWVAFEAVVVEKKAFDNSVITSYYYRLTDGTDEYYWNGAAWVVSTSSWNTEQEINEGLSSWTNSAIGFIVNPRTSDDEVTPEVLELKLLYDGRVDFLRDLQVSLTELLKDQFRSWIHHTVQMAATSSTINLSTSAPESTYTISDVLAVYDHTADPGHNTDLLQSYSDPVITLTSPISSGHTALIVLEYVPQIAYGTDVDYIEHSEVPSIYIEDLTITSRRGRTREYVLRKDTNIAWQMKDVRFGNVFAPISVHAGKPDDQSRLAGQLEEFFATVQQVRSLALDDLYDIQNSESYSNRQGPDRKGEMSSRYGVLIRDVLLAASAVQRYGIQRFNLDLRVR